jgi:choline dehydrogenase
VRYDGHSPVKGHGFMILTGPNKPKSRGYVRLTSSDPYVHPHILFNYLDREEDRKGFRDCIRLTREVMAQPAMDAFNDGEIAPGPGVSTDDQMDDFVRDNLESTYHPCGSCRMGVDDMAVVDPELKVHGIDGLRVVDSSVFPSEPNGNLNAPTMMLAERAADLIAGRPVLAPENAPVGASEGIGQSQRPNAPLRSLS